MLRLLRVPASLAAAVMLAGCSLPYYWQAVGGQVDLLTSRTPLERALEDETLDARTRRVLARVPEILAFAAERLELSSDGSYRSYVHLDRPYAVWNVVAAPEFSVDPVQWCFPFAGCVAYRGYFDAMDARAFEAELAADGFDTYLGGATAYSTLGYFDDPVLNTMLAGGVDSLAGLLFHELAHQKVYVKGDTEFNEAYATAVEEHGMRLWLAEHADDGALAAYLESRRRRDAFAELVLRQQRRLAAVYASGADVEAKRRDKREAFERMRAEYAELRREWGGDAAYDAWFETELNNARLAALATYRRWLPALRARVEAVGIAAFQTEIAAVAMLDDDERAARLASWESAAGSGRTSD